jgi:hypothetical protein
MEVMDRTFILADFTPGSSTCPICGRGDITEGDGYQARCGRRFTTLTSIAFPVDAERMAIAEKCNGAKRSP